MPQPETLSDAVLCLFRIARACMLPFFLGGADDDEELACAAILDMVQAYKCATAMELNLVGRIVMFSAAAMDSLRLSMQPNLSDTKICLYRASAVALDRSAEQCRKILEAMQIKRRQERAQAATLRSVVAEAPAPTASPSPPEVPAAQSQNSASPIAAIDENYRFESDIEIMRFNALAIIANPRAVEEMTDADAFEGSLRAMLPDAVPRDHAATTATAHQHDAAA